MDRHDHQDDRRDMTTGTDSHAGYVGEPGATRDMPGDTIGTGYAPSMGDTGGHVPGTAADPNLSDPAYSGTAADAGYAGTAGYPGTGVDHWNRRDDAGWGMDQEVIGYHVEATDGRIGKIDEASTAVDASYLVVDTGPWIFGKKVMLPAGMVQRVDTADQLIYVNCTKDQVKNSPEFNADTYTSPEYRDDLGSYYAGGRDADYPRP